MFEKSLFFRNLKAVQKKKKILSNHFLGSFKNFKILKKTFRVNSESIGYFDIKEWNNSLAVFETKVKTCSGCSVFCLHSCIFSVYVSC